MGREPNNYSADAITGCTRTSENTLSVWFSDKNDFASDDVEKLIVALATTMQKPDTIDIVLLDPIWLQDNSIDIEKTDGGSKFTEVNQHHRDLSTLDLGKLGIVASHIVSQLNEPKNYKKFLRRELIALVKKWLGKCDSFTVEDLYPSWKEAIKK